MEWSGKDKQQFTDKGIDIQEIEKQISQFKNGFPFLNIEKAATINEGIIKLEKEEFEYYIRSYNYATHKLNIIKFVPASGAASRMFKDLFEFKQKLEEGSINNLYINNIDKESIKLFFDKLAHFAFLDDLQNVLLPKQIKEVLNERNYFIILEALLGTQGLNYGEKP